MSQLMPIVVFLSWLSLPVLIVCIFDDWFLRPRRTLAAVAAPATSTGAADGAAVPAPPPAPRDPPVMNLLYNVLPVLIAAAVLRLLLAERLDFSAVLLGITVVTGLVWALDALWLGPQRAAAARGVGRSPEAVAEPGTVDYARSFFPVALVVLLLRSFVFEPFRIPSDSMMPTLLDGDFIIVNKYTYGLRLPVLNRKVVRYRRAAARRCGGVPLAGRPIRELHQAPGGPAGGSCRGARQSHRDQRQAGAVLCWAAALQRRLLRQPVAGARAARRPSARGDVLPGGARPRTAPALGCNRSGLRGYVCGDEDAPGGMRAPPFVGDGAAGALSDDG